jgi:hypothetical protein
MFEQKLFPPINVNYNLRNDEIILSQSMLMDGYFDNLHPQIENKYVKFNTYDTAEPLLTELYENIYDASVDEQVNCTTDIGSLSTEFKKYFTDQKEYHILRFNPNAPLCSFEVILFILKSEGVRTGNKRLENVTVNILRLIILHFYNMCIQTSQNSDEIKEKIVAVLKFYGMTTISEEYDKKIKAHNDDDFIEAIPFLENYYLTRLDIWIIANYYKVPIILLYYPKKPLLETKYVYSTLTTYYQADMPVLEEEEEEERGSGAVAGEARSHQAQDTQKYYFIIVPSIKPNTTPTYSLVRKGDNNYFLSISELKPIYQSKIIQEMSKTYSTTRDDAAFNDDAGIVLGEGEAAVDSVASATTGFKKNIMNFVTNFVPPTILQKRNYEEGSSFASSSVMQDSPPLGGIDEDEEAGQVGPPRSSSLGAKVISAKSGKKKKPNLFALSPISEAVSVASPKLPQASVSRKGKPGLGKVSSVSVVTPQPSVPQLTLSELRSRALASKKGKPRSVVEVPSASADVASSPPPPPPSLPPSLPPPSMNVSGDTTESIEE